MTVFITQEMRGRDITDAVSFGDVEIIIPFGEQAAFSTQPTIRRIEKTLRKFSDKDYLILAGDPVVIALSACIASRNNNGKFNMLKWDRQEEKYYPLCADFNYRPGGNNE